MPTKVTLVIHHRELKRTTNTGKLLVAALENSEMIVRGLKEVKIQESRKEFNRSSNEGLNNTIGGDKCHKFFVASAMVSPNYQPLLFFPYENSAELTPEFLKKFQDMNRPFQLIVPDGNWRQASKVGTRQPELALVPRIKLMNRPDSKNFMRAEHTSFGMSTLEAVALALGIIENSGVQQTLTELYLRKLEATIKGRFGGPL